MTDRTFLLFNHKTKIIMIVPKVKICCILNSKEAELAISMGASAVGLVSEMPSGPGVISEEEIKDIVKYVNNRADTFLLTSKQNVTEIIEQLKKCNPSTVQIVDKILDGNYNDIRNECPDIKIVQVLHVIEEDDIQEAINISHEVDAILLDSGNQNLAVKELGGTGRVHDWSISKKIVDSVKIPVYLAGGLNPENINEAIKSVRPFGIDICSGVRSEGKLSKSKLSTFFSEINSISSAYE